jgi:hypothetical protein
MKYLISTLLFLALSLGLSAQSEQINLDWPVPTGNTDLLAIASDPVHGKTYIGGNFTRIQHQTPYTATVDLATGLPDAQKLRPNDEILAAVPDGNGGFFIGGKFTKIDGVPRSYLARHLLPRPGKRNALLRRPFWQRERYSPRTCRCGKCHHRCAFTMEPEP